MRAEAESHRHGRGLIEYANGPSLEEVNGSISVPHNISFAKTLFMYSGPGALVAVGYMDPGNWSTSITGGQNFSYLLMSVILLSSLIAMLLQYMAAKLGIVSQMDLAQAIRARTGKALSVILWILTELAIMATDIAEVIGAAIALYLLFRIPLVLDVFITVGDVLLLLLLTRIGFRKIEAIVVCLIAVILLVFLYHVVLSKPDWAAVAAGLIPTGKTFAGSPHIGGQTPITGALGIIGATIMPHNLYLGSSISQIRAVDHHNQDDVARSVRFSTWDSNIQLSLAWVINSLLLIMGVSVFKSGAVEDPSFFGLFEALSNASLLSNQLLINVAKSGILSILFAVALLASGQNSTITGTLTGQIIMEGYVHMRMPLWLRRLVTRLISVIPVLITVAMTAGDTAVQQHEALNDLLNNSQVFLAFALPFSMVPVLILTNSTAEMGRRFRNNILARIFGWISVISLTCLNLMGLPDSIAGFMGHSPTPAQIAMAHRIAYVMIIAVLVLLAWTIVDMYRGDRRLATLAAKAARQTDGRDAPVDDVEHDEETRQ